MVIMYRVFLGLYISYHHDYEMGTLLMVGIGLGFVMFNIINLPFVSVL